MDERWASTCSTTPKLIRSGTGKLVNRKHLTGKRWTAQWIFTILPFKMYYFYSYTCLVVRLGSLLSLNSIWRHFYRIRIENHAEMLQLTQESKNLAHFLFEILSDNRARYSPYFWQLQHRTPTSKIVEFKNLNRNNKWHANRNLLFGKRFIAYTS